MGCNFWEMLPYFCVYEPSVRIVNQIQPRSPAATCVARCARLSPKFIGYASRAVVRHFKDSKRSSYVTKTRLSYWHYVLLLDGFLLVGFRANASLSE